MGARRRGFGLALSLGSVAAYLACLVVTGCGPASGGDRKTRAAGSGPTRDVSAGGPLRVSGAAAARSLYLLLKHEDFHAVTLQDLTTRVPGSGRDLDLEGLRAIVGALHGRAQVRREPLGTFLARARPGLLLGRGREAGRAGRLLFWPGGKPGPDIRLVDPELGARIWPRRALEGDYLGATLTVAARPPGPAPDGPDLVVDELAWNFGEVTRGARVSHVFRLRNAGRRALTLRSVKTTCGCAPARFLEVGARDLPPAVVYPERPASRVEKRPEKRRPASRHRILRPGETAGLLVVFDTNHKGNPQRVTAEIVSSDPEERLVRLCLEGRVVRRFTCRPELIFFREVSGQARYEARLDVTSVTGQPFRLTALRTTSRFVRAALETPGRHGSGASPRHVVKVTLEPGLPAGPFAGHVCFRADGFPRAVAVAALVQGNVTIRPPQFRLGRVRRGAGATARVVLTGRRGAALRITEATVDHPGMTVHEEELAAGRHRLVLALAPGWTGPELKATVTVHTNDPARPQVSIPVVGFVARDR